MVQELPDQFNNLKHKKGLIDLASNCDGDFGLDEYSLSFVFDDIVLVEFVDEVNHGNETAIERNGILVPVNATTKAWRKAKVVLAGPNCNFTKVGDIVLFPNDKGVTVSNIDVTGYGNLGRGMFLNEQRLFGVATPKEKTIEVQVVSETTIPSSVSETLKKIKNKKS